MMLFCAGNCAINRALVGDAVFDEDFRFAEDLELVSRIEEKYQWIYVPDMKIRHYSRDTFRQYAMQMYRYGFMKQYFSFTSGCYRWLDFVPLALLVISGIAGSSVLVAIAAEFPVLTPRGAVRRLLSAVPGKGRRPRPADLDRQEPVLELRSRAWPGGASRRRRYSPPPAGQASRQGVSR